MILEERQFLILENYRFLKGIRSEAHLWQTTSMDEIHTMMDLLSGGQF